MAFPKRIEMLLFYKLVVSALLLSSLLNLNSCSYGNPNSTLKTARILMGTLIEITVVGPQDKLQETTDAALAEIKRIEDLASFHKETELTEINKRAGISPVRVKPELVSLIERALEISKLTDGAFDPTIGAIALLWNFSESEAPRLPGKDEIDQALKKVGWQKVEISTDKNEVFLPEKGMALDLGGIAKCYSVNRAEEVIKSKGIKSALINAGGDIAAFGGKEPGVPWKVGIQDPRDNSGIAAVVEVESGLVFTSGDYERFFEKNGKRYHHILDPKTGYPATRAESVTIVAPDGTRVEGLPAAIFVLGPKKGMRLLSKFKDVSCLIIDPDGKIIISPNAGSLFQVRR
ncbi:MAG: FAD:protein FMN transferase [Deltaproteobacteria bacterium]|nr:FAD:protein FMN transferase [Deltaproteobacteria bacterium]